MNLRTESLLSGVRRIAVLRANALGDFIFSLPALEALRMAYPRAEIVLLGLDWHVAFLQGRPGPVNRVIPIPRCWDGVAGLLRDEDAPILERTLQPLVAQGVDLAVQLHGGGRNSNPLVRRLHAACTIGMQTPDAPPLDRVVPYIYYQPEVLRYLEVVALVGAGTRNIEPCLAVTAADLAEAAHVVPGTPDPLVALHPGATDPRRQWPVEAFAAVGDALAEAGARVVVTGTAGERELVDGVVSAMRYPALGLAGRLPLNGLVGLLSRCRVVVSNDSGPLHLAAAVGAATVGIYWCGNVINGGPLSRARHRPAISWQLGCTVCGADATRIRCPHTASFVAGVPVDEVIGQALDLFTTSEVPR
jgi:ADP-heptose:LPS heptosyltransferase